MALVSLTLIGKENVPLYAREFTADANTKYHVEGQLAFEDEFFGKSGLDCDCSLRQQFLLNAALDRFEELAGPQAMMRWRTPGSTGSDAMWVGLICPVEEFRVYGYLSTTKIKFLAVVEDSILPDQIQQQQSQEAKLKALFVNLHNLYVEYRLNPFSDVNCNIITSKHFDEGVTRICNAYNGAGSANI